MTKTWYQCAAHARRVSLAGAGVAMPVSSFGAYLHIPAHMAKDARTREEMVQTKAGSQNNPWLEHLRQCSAEYHKRRAAEHASSAAEHRAAASATDTLAEEKPVRRRVVGKQPDAKAKRVETDDQDGKKRRQKTGQEEGG